MPAPRGFPKNPLRDRPDPFRDAQGQNPFSEGGPAPAPAGDDPYAVGAAAGDASKPMAPVYEAWLPSRGGTILTYGILGFVFSALGALICGPGMLFSLYLSLAAAIMGQKDLAAMRAGAMVKKGHGLTVAGFWLGLIGSLTTFTIGCFLAWRLMQDLFDEL